MTFAELSDEWLARHAVVNKGVRSVQDNRSMLKRDILPKIGAMRPWMRRSAKRTASSTPLQAEVMLVDLGEGACDGSSCTGRTASPARARDPVHRRSDATPGRIIRPRARRRRSRKPEPASVLSGRSRS